MDEFTELYENLSPNKLSIENVTQLESRVEILEQEVKQLEAALNQSELDKRNLNINCERDKANLLKNHERLLANVSALFKTAKKEIERKNNIIKELRQQCDDLIFRRHQRRYPPPNEVVQSENEDDAICAKAASEEHLVASIIRPTARSHVFSDREKSSSGDKSPLPAQIENTKKDDRIKCIEDTALKRRIKDYNELGVSDDYFNSRNSANSHSHRRSDIKIREADDRERRIRRNAKDRHRYSPYEHRKEDHQRSRYKPRPRERGYSDEEYSKSRSKRSPLDRHEFADGYRIDDFRLEDECGSCKTNEDRRSDRYSRAASDHRRREAESRARKSIEDRTGNVEVNSRKPNDDWRKADVAPPEPYTRTSIENRRKDAVSREKSNEERKRDSPATVGNSHDVRRRDDLVFNKSDNEKSLKDRSRKDMVCQKSILDRKRRKEKLDHLVKDPKTENPANFEFASRKSIADQKKDLINQKMVVVGQNSTEDQRSENSVTQPEYGKKLIEERRKENPAHLELSHDHKNPVHSRIASKKLVKDRKRELGGEKSIVDPKRTNPVDAKCVVMPNGNRPSEDVANSSQNGFDNPVPSSSHVEVGFPVDGQMKAVDILAQYGVYATPYKLLNGDKCTFAGFKLVSPIADTPDHLKALFNDAKIKVSPIPMINERRVLEGFNSPAKRPVAPAGAAKDRAPTVKKSSNEEPSKRFAENSGAPNPSKHLLLNTVTTSPFKNCCIVKVKAEVANNSLIETASKEPVTVSGTDTTNAEHGVFTRKRRAPVIRHIKKAES